MRNVVLCIEKAHWVVCCSSEIRVVVEEIVHASHAISSCLLLLTMLLGLDLHDVVPEFGLVVERVVELVLKIVVHVIVKDRSVDEVSVEERLGTLWVGIDHWNQHRTFNGWPQSWSLRNGLSLVILILL